VGQAQVWFDALSNHIDGYSGHNYLLYYNDAVQKEKRPSESIIRTCIISIDCWIALLPISITEAFEQQTQRNE
jgi:hypothetical protein